MSTFTEIFIPGVIVTIANIFSYEHGSHRYERVSALFYWTAAGCIFIFIIADFTSFILAIRHIDIPILESIRQITFQICALSSVTAISRDYEKLLKPKAAYFEIKLKSLYRALIKKIKR